MLLINFNVRLKVPANLEQSKVKPAQNLQRAYQHKIKS